MNNFCRTGGIGGANIAKTGRIHVCPISYDLQPDINSSSAREKHIMHMGIVLQWQLRMIGSQRTALKIWWKLHSRKWSNRIHRLLEVGETIPRFASASTEAALDGPPVVFRYGRTSRTADLWDDRFCTISWVHLCHRLREKQEGILP